MFLLAPLAFLSALAVSATAAGAAQVQPEVASILSQTTLAMPLVLRGVTVIDVETGARRAWQTVVIDGSRIRAVGAAGVVNPPKDAFIIDARGKYLIPGL